MPYDPMKHLNLVVGLGKTGLSCVRFCLRQGWPVAVTDSRKNPPLKEELLKIAPKIETGFGCFSERLITRAGQLIVSPGVSLQEPAIAEAIAQGTPFVGDIELFIQQISAPIIAITGSNAKSTVTALVGEMAKHSHVNVSVAGNIGAPVLDTLVDKLASLYVLELSSFQLETTRSLKAKAATILNISEDHMDRYSGMEDYIAAKQIIYQNCEVAVVNRADKRTYPVGFVPKKIISFGLDEPQAGQYGLIHVNKEVFLACGDQPLLNVKEMKIQGNHNVENALASLALAEVAHIKIAGCLKALREFPGLRHRCQLVCERDGVSWYNDSKGTNVGATQAALNGLKCSGKNKIILIAGGVGKGQDFSPLREPIKKYVREVILIGEAADLLEKTFKGCCKLTHAKTFEGALQQADLAALRGDKIVLSPACASFDMFKNYEHRGDVFIELVQELNAV